MTQPTQAQIEAAARAFHEQSCDVGGNEPCAWCLDGAEAALTAAAEAGNQSAEKRTFNQIVVENGRLRSELYDCIERCAQVAEWEGYATVGRQIAAAIRALKNQL